MSVAQQLYEGLNIGKAGVVELVTYIRTDATRVSQEALTAVRAYIGDTFGKQYLPEKPQVYAAKKGAQEAHEAIRPTSVGYTPAQVKEFLTRDQYRLYKLIWERFVASQMSPAVYDTVTAKINISMYEFRATGSQIKFGGFMKLYTESQDDEKRKRAPAARIVPGQKLKLLQFKPEQHFTQPRRALVKRCW